MKRSIQTRVKSWYLELRQGNPSRWAYNGVYNNPRIADSVYIHGYTLDEALYNFIQGFDVWSTYAENSGFVHIFTLPAHQYEDEHLMAIYRVFPE